MSLELSLSARVEEWRAKIAAGTLTHEEAKEAIQAIRQGRLSAASASKRSAGGGSKAPVDAASLMQDLDSI